MCNASGSLGNQKSEGQASHITVANKNPKAGQNLERIADVLESIGDYVYSLDRDWNFIYVNRRSANDWGFKPDALVGKNYWQTFPELVGTTVEENFRQSVAKKQVRCFEWKTIYLKGLREFTVFPFAEGITVYGKDITERKEIEEELRRSEERFRVVAEAANVMVYETDVSTGKITIFRGLEALTGYKPNEVNVTVDWVLSNIHPDDVASVLSQFKPVVEGDRPGYAIKYRFKHKSGKYVTVKDTAKAIRDAEGKAIRIIGGIRDISQREKDRERIEQYSNHLEELVKERTKQLQDSARLATIGQVAGMVGHDIRNPLQAAVSELFCAKQTIAGAPEGRCKQDMLESLSIIQEQIDYIGKIVSDLQDYAKPVKPELVDVSICQFIPEALKTLPIPGPIQASEVCEEGIPPIKLDLTLMRRILTNLVNNAIQAMPNGGKLTIRAFKKDKQVIIAVEDTGVGIPEEIKPKLFKPMFTTKAKGQGFGLAVVKRMVEALGGNISFESEVGKGTTFTVSLPIEKS